MRIRTTLIPLLLLLLLAIPAVARAAAADHAHVSPDLHEIDAWGEHARTAKIMLVLFQLAAMLAAAKSLGWLSEKIHVPGVVGELSAGILIGPYVLGAAVHVPLAGHFAPLFPRPGHGQWPVNDVVWSIAQLASIVLLFITGLHTDLKQFLKYVGPATLVAIAGLIIPFALGAACVAIPPFARLAAAEPGQSVLVPALFVGAILAATSIGITARVLADIGKLDTPEGVTILGAAVLDDVLGIIALAIVGGIASEGSVSAGAVGAIAAKAFGFWIGLTVLIFALSRPIERLLGHINYAGAAIGLSLSLALACSGAAEGFGLAFIIGAYSVGLGLSLTSLTHRLLDELRPISEFVVPIFFAALGMLVNPAALVGGPTVIAFGLTVCAAAVVGKLIGCGAAALPTGFNLRGAVRIGLGMLPRGEVALIVAGVGLSRHLVGDVVFGVSILMTLVTTVLAPVLLVPAFKAGGSGRRRPGDRAQRLPTSSQLPGFSVELAPGLSEVFLARLLAAYRAAGWAEVYDEPGPSDLSLLRSGDDAAQIRVDRGRVLVGASDNRQAELLGLAEAVRRELMAETVDIKVNPRRDTKEHEEREDEDGESRIEDR